LFVAQLAAAARGADAAFSITWPSIATMYEPGATSGE
jgi:hypothetical protein